MSILDRGPAVTRLAGSVRSAPGPVHEVQQGKTVPLGGSTEVRRLLPNLGRRLVGAWCFVDHYGPDDVASAPRHAGAAAPAHRAADASAGCSRARCTTATASAATNWCSRARSG